MLSSRPSLREGDPRTLEALAANTRPVGARHAGRGVANRLFLGFRSTENATHLGDIERNDRVVITR